MTTVRLDVWLDIACLFRTRSEAQKACQGGKVEVNGQSCKPHRQLRVGDELRLSRPFGRKQTLTVLGIAERHVPKSEARLLYRDTTPPLSEEEKEMRRIERIYRAGIQRTHVPDKRERRALRKLKGR
jgi:ribosome-associated heat shock protein Hsp15